jgi:phosphoadenosine phosphosulfate reductase
MNNRSIDTAQDVVIDEAAVVERLAAQLAVRYGRLPAPDLLQAVVQREFPGEIAVVSSFGAESAVILSLVAEVDPAVPVIFLETGKHFPETLAYRDELVARLGLTNLRSIEPSAVDVASRDPDGRLWERDGDRCCQLRKVEPLGRALSGYTAWITGRKRFHGGERTRLVPFEASGGRVKVNPLAEWTPAQIAEAFRDRGLPVHPLIARGYPSIGCAPCTQPVAEGDEVRAGRWAGTEKTECGIHRSPWF